jgi:DNA-binding protein Fis
MEMETKKAANAIDDTLFVKNAGNVYGKVMENTEKLLIEKALKRAYGNQSIAAKILGINRNTLRVKIKKLGIDVKNFKI